MDHDPLALDCGAQQLDHIADNAIDIDQDMTRPLFAEQRPDTGNHLRLPAPAHDRADDLFLAAGLTVDFAQGVNVPDRAAAADDADLAGKTRAAFDRHRDRRVEAGAVVGMHPVAEQLKGRDYRGPVGPEDVEQL